MQAYDCKLTMNYKPIGLRDGISLTSAPDFKPACFFIVTCDQIILQLTTTKSKTRYERL